MRFDAYAATIRNAEFAYVAESISNSIGAIVSRGKPMRRYAQTLTLDNGPHMAAWVGFDQASGAVYIEGKGDTAPQLAQGIRVHFPQHSVARADVCEDYDEPGAFESLQRTVRAHKGPRVKGGYVALPDDVQDGRTWSAGVRGGDAYIRVYEAGKHPDRLHLNRPNWARAELECRPHYARDKQAASSMSPIDFWGMCSWSHRVGEALTNCSITRFEPQVRKYSHDKTTRYIANTFRRHLKEMLADGLDISRTFQAVWEEDDLANKRGVSGS